MRIMHVASVSVQSGALTGENLFLFATQNHFLIINSNVIKSDLKEENCSFFFSYDIINWFQPLRLLCHFNQC